MIQYQEFNWFGTNKTNIEEVIEELQNTVIAQQKRIEALEAKVISNMPVSVSERILPPSPYISGTRIPIYDYSDFDLLFC
jgi:BioD-like phosphotransacetylase family protein